MSCCPPRNRGSVEQFYGCCLWASSTTGGFDRAHFWMRLVRMHGFRRKKMCNLGLLRHMPGLFAETSHSSALAMLVDPRASKLASIIAARVQACTRPTHT